MPVLLSGCGGGSTSGGGAGTSSAATFGPAANNPNVVVQTARQYYDVVGVSTSELRQELQVKGPGNYYGSITSTISYEYTARGNCSVAGIRAMVVSQLTLPRWTAPAGVSVALQNEWNRFVAALENHELNHVRIDISEAEKFLAAVFGLPGFPTCNELDAAIAQLHNQTIQSATAANTLYDDQTNHGEVEGAVL